MSQYPNEFENEYGQSPPKPKVIPARRADRHKPQQEGAPYQGNPGRQPVRYSNAQSPYRPKERRQPVPPPQYEEEYNNTSHAGAYQQPYGYDVENRGSTAPVKPPKKAKKRKKKHTLAWSLVSFLCIILIASLGILMAPQLTGGFFRDMPNLAFAGGRILEWNEDTVSRYKLYRDYIVRDTFFPGIYIDGISVGDMTMEQAREALAQSTVQAHGAFSVSVVIGNMTWNIDNTKIPITRNTEELLEKAFAIGRQNTTRTLGTTVTPMGERVTEVLDVRESGRFFTTEMTYDKEAVRTFVDDIVTYVNRDPVDAQLQSFSFENRSFEFSEEQDGWQVDGDEIYRQVIAKLDSGEYGASLQFQVEPVLARVTKLDLMGSFKKITSFTTKTTSNNNRNTNIDLSAKAINGIVVEPGKTFSFNEATGKRTEAAGYKEAIAISGGQNVPDIGGGVCQTSSTLFNAVIRADLEIVERTPHAWPSSYVDIGMDATVNWPNLDFKFKNNKDFPVFIVAYYSDRTVTVEIYGKSLGNGVYIDLVSEITRTLNPSSEINYVQNTNLPAGTSKETIQARTGYEVRTDKIWYQDGNPIKTESYTSKYKSYQKTIEYN